MEILNQMQTVPQNVRGMFYNIIPFGSEYVIYCSSYSPTEQVYDLYYSRPVLHDQHHFSITHQSGGDYILNEDSEFSTSYDGYVVSHPYYSYSSLSAQGIKETLPVTYDIIAFMGIVIASLLILKTVFGGIKLWSDRIKQSL